MKFILVEEEDKRNYFDLLLSADEQPSMRKVSRQGYYVRA